MDTDSKENLKPDYFNLAVSLIFKIEIVFIFLCASGNIPEYLERGLIVTVICTIVNQCTETFYIKKTTLRQRLLLLFKSLLIILGVFLIFYLLTVKFTYVWREKTMIDKANIWRVAELMLGVFIGLFSMRLTAVFIGYLLNWLERRKRLKS